MINKKWIVKISTISDFPYWIEFIKIVQHDFHNINLVNDKKFLLSIKKHLSNSSAIYVEDSLNINHFIGILLYDQKKSHIDCLAVHPKHRRKGIASSLLNFMFEQNPNSKIYMVETFLKNDPGGKAARNFYIKHGFIPQDILYIDKKYNYSSQLFLKYK